MSGRIYKANKRENKKIKREANLFFLTHRCRGEKLVCKEETKHYYLEENHPDSDVKEGGRPERSSRVVLHPEDVQEIVASSDVVAAKVERAPDEDEWIL